MAIQRLTQVCLRLNADKCQFFLRAFKGLGHRITPDGIQVDPEKVASIKAIPLPASYQDLSNFLGILNYVREHVRHYSEMAGPLQDLLATEGRKNTSHPSKTKRPPWTPDTIQRFESLKDAIARAPTLSYPHPDRPFTVYIDASIEGHGSVLCQPKLPGDPITADTVVTFRSHKLKPYERGYAGSPYKLELLALVTALRDYHTYLWCKPFTVYTDHRALTFIHQQKDTNRHLATWMDRIMDYDFKVSHIPGRENGFADALSRMYPSTWGIPSEKTHTDPSMGPHPSYFTLIFSFFN